MLRGAVDGLDSTTGIVALAAAGVALLALILALVAIRRLHALGAAQRAVLGEHGRDDVVAHGVETRRRVDEIAAWVQDTAGQLNGRTDAVEAQLSGTVSRSAVLRYDAFNETSGRQSSTVALFDEHGDGIVISAILQREQARVYAKPIRGGESELELSPEEREAIRIAEERARS